MTTTTQHHRHLRKNNNINNNGINPNDGRDLSYDYDADLLRGMIGRTGPDDNDASSRRFLHGADEAKGHWSILASDRSPDSNRTFDPKVFWCVNAFILFVMVTGCSCFWYRWKRSNGILVTSLSTSTQQRDNENNGNTTTSTQQPKRKIDPEKRKQKLLLGIQKHHVSKIISEKDLLQHNPLASGDDNAAVEEQYEYNLDLKTDEYYGRDVDDNTNAKADDQHEQNETDKNALYDVEKQQPKQEHQTEHTVDTRGISTDEEEEEEAWESSAVHTLSEDENDYVGKDEPACTTSNSDELGTTPCEKQPDPENTTSVVIGMDYIVEEQQEEAAEPENDGGQECEVRSWKEYDCKLKDLSCPDGKDWDDGSTLDGCSSHPFVQLTDQCIAPNCCAICLGRYDIGERVVWSPNPKCIHAFHCGCIVDWLVKIKSKQFDGENTTPCPCCRQQFIPGVDLRDEDEERQQTERQRIAARRERRITWRAGNAFNAQHIHFR